MEYIATQAEVKVNLWARVSDNGNNTFRGLRVVDRARNFDWAYFEFSDPYARPPFSLPPTFPSIGVIIYA